MNIEEIKLLQPFLVKINKSNSKTKKYTATFYNKEKKKLKTISFGAKGYEDYTIHKDKKRKELYIYRHIVKEDWTKPMSAGTLSRYILWNKPSLEESIKDYKKMFNLK